MTDFIIVTQNRERRKEDSSDKARFRRPGRSSERIPFNRKVTIRDEILESAKASREYLTYVSHRMILIS